VLRSCASSIAKSLGCYVGSVKTKALELRLTLSRKVKARGNSPWADLSRKGPFDQAELKAFKAVFRVCCGVVRACSRKNA
jgi:hypothetical protein